MDEHERSRLREVFATYAEVGGVWLFGSHARGAATARSDVDLAVDPIRSDAGAARRRKLDMLTDLVSAGFEDVDLVILDGDDPVLRFEAISPNVLIYSAPSYDAPEAFAQALRAYDDAAPLRAIMRNAFYEELLKRDR